MLMRDINLLLPSAIRTMRSALQDVSRQQIPFTVEGLVRQGLPEKYGEELRRAAKDLGGERLAVARFIVDLFALNREDFAARASLKKWLSTHEKDYSGRLRTEVRKILLEWNEEEFGPGALEDRMINLDMETPGDSRKHSTVFRLF